MTVSLLKTAFIFACCLNRFAFAQDDLTVLLKDKRGPKNDSVQRFLLQKAKASFVVRQKAYSELKTTQQVSEYQSRMRAQFIEQLGGFPQRTPLNAVMVGRLHGDGYSIEKLIYESQPQHFVTAVLFLPKSQPPYPGVLVPCGHSRSGKAAQQRICILLAKNGIAALSYDPIGQGERSQILNQKGKQRFRATSEHNVLGRSSMLLGRNTATYRVWDGMRSIDYLVSRKEIDSKRIGVTGCSGGGTLTSYLMALDDRVQCAAPSCYITSLERLLETIGPQDAEQNIHAQIRFGMDHADYLMMRAPKPTLILASTRDFFDIDGTWDSFRQAKRLYTRIGFAERVSLIETDAKHGYPKLQREAMVRWMRRFLQANNAPVTETESAIHSESELLCAPKGQAQLLKGARSVIDLNIEIDSKLRETRRENWTAQRRAETLRVVRKITGVPTFDQLPKVKITRRGRVDRNGYAIAKLLLETAAGVVIPALKFEPDQATGRQVLYVTGEGKPTATSQLADIEALVAKGQTVLAIDLRGTGETKTSGRSATIAYLLGHSMVGMRTVDILLAARELGGGKSVHLFAEDSAKIPALHAAALEPKLFAALQLKGDVPKWSAVVANPIPARTSDLIHGALRVYDLPDLLGAYRAMRLAANR